MHSKAKKVGNPDFINKVFDCPCCGGQFKVTRRTAVKFTNVTGVSGGGARVVAACPYCGGEINLNADPHKPLRDKLTRFILSQVAPIKAITDENVRLPMEHLLDDINRLVQEDN